MTGGLSEGAGLLQENGIHNAHGPRARDWSSGMAREQAIRRSGVRGWLYTLEAGVQGRERRYPRRNDTCSRAYNPPMGVCTRYSHTDHTAMSPAEVTEKLGLHKMRDRSWYVHPR